MFETFHQDRWPNIISHSSDIRIGGHAGICRFSQGEIERRQNLVRAKLKELDCDLLIAQGYFPPATMGSQTSIYWLSGYNGYRNTMTLILPRDGELVRVPGVKFSSSDGVEDPYIAVYDMDKYIKGAKRIAYDGTGFMTHGFRQYLLDTCPGVEIVNFSNELGHMKAQKSAEEIEAVKDAIYIHDKVFASAAAFLQPGRTAQDITADITHLLWSLGADATLMGKILINFMPNRAVTDQDRARGHVHDPERRLRRDDVVDIGLESPGSTGYYAQRHRIFAFSEPYADIQAAFSKSKQLYARLLDLLTPGQDWDTLYREMNAFAESIGQRPTERGGEGLEIDRVSGLGGGGLIRGIGMLTVDRPQPQFPWEDLKLQVGHTVVAGGFAMVGDHATNIGETVVIEPDGAKQYGRYPLELTVL